MFPTGTFEEEIDPVFIKKVEPEHWNFSDKIAFENSWTTTILIQKNIVHFISKSPPETNSFGLSPWSKKKSQPVGTNVS